MRRFSMILLVSFCLGCGDDSPSLDTGLSSGAPIGDLSAEQSAQVCAGVERFANELIGPSRQEQVRCTIAGIAFELGGFGSCSAARDTCYDEGTTQTVEIDLACDAATGTYLPGCEATIGQLEACANDVGAAADAVLDSISCALVDDAEGRAEIGEDIEVSLDPAAYTSCANLAEACLAFLELPDISVDVSIE